LTNDKSLTALLTTTELEWLRGKKKVSKGYQYRIRSDIKKKLQVFQVSELPLLAQNGFIIELSVFTQLSANTQNTRSTVQLSSKNNLVLANNSSDLSSVGLKDENNTYKNNNTDKDGRAGGLAWLGYRLDMAGITCSNHVRPTINLIIMISILQIFSRICLKIINYIKVRFR
jgi:hypothetical protein